MNGSAEIKVLGTRIPEECREDLRNASDSVEMIQVLIDHDVIAEELLDADLLKMIGFLSTEKAGLDTWTSGNIPRR